MNENQASQESLHIGSPKTDRALRLAKPPGSLDKLTLSGRGLLQQKLAAEVRSWGSIREIYVFQTVTHAALRQLLSKPELQALYVSSINRHGSLERMSPPLALQSFRCGFGLSSSDIRAICQFPQLRDLSAQHASLSLSALEAVIGVKTLRALDLEANRLSDDMAAILGSSREITDLDIGASHLTSAGLAHVCKMVQLRGLDIWATDICEADLDMLQMLPSLQYLSVGGYEGQRSLTAKGVLPRLAALPSLNRIWIDGIDLTERQAAELRERYEYVRIV